MSEPKTTYRIFGYFEFDTEQEARFAQRILREGFKGFGLEVKQETMADDGSKNMRVVSK